MGGWCRYKIAQLSGRPGPPARSGRRRPFPRSAVPRSRRGTRPVAPGPQGAQRQLPASSPEPAAPSGGAGRTEVRAALGSGRRAAPGPVSPAGPARRREPGLHRQLEDVVRWRSGSEAGAPERRALSPRAPPEEAPSEGCGPDRERGCYPERAWRGRDTTAGGVRARKTLVCTLASSPGVEGEGSHSLHVISQTLLKYRKGKNSV